MSEVGSLSMAAAGELRSPVSCSSEPDDSMEPYTTERLSRLPGGYKPLTEPFTALNIDFNNVQVSRSREDNQCREGLCGLHSYQHISFNDMRCS